MIAPTISVVMPTYNAADYVETAIESILNQTIDDFELIVIDDGSSDRTVERIEAFDDERIRILEREDETGVTSARNRGVSEANGIYVAVHDADDWSDSRRFESQLSKLEANPEVALVGTGAYLIDEDGEIRERRRVLESPTFETLLEHNEFVHGSVMIRKDALEAVEGYNESFELSEDFDLYLSLCQDYILCNIDEPLYYLRIHESSLYGSQLERLKLYGFLSRRRHTDGIAPKTQTQIDEHGIDVLQKYLTESERFQFHADLALENLRYRRLTDARQHCKNALKLSPWSPSLCGIYVLSFTTPRITQFVARNYRKVVNQRIRLQNRTSGPND